MPLVRVQERKKDVKGYIRCTHSTWLGNPFPVSKYGLERSLDMYKLYLTWRINNDNIFRDYLINIGEKALRETVKLGCGCKLENKCHVDILIKFISNLQYGVQLKKEYYEEKMPQLNLFEDTHFKFKSKL